MLLTTKIKILFCIELISNILTSIIGIISFSLLLLLLNHPISVDELQQFNIFFYIHVLTAITTYILFILLLILLLIYLLLNITYITPIIKKLNILTFLSSIFTLVNGIFWGIFSWGDIIINDPNIYKLVGICIINIIIHLFILKINNNMVLYIVLILLLFIIPCIMYITLWISSYHQGSSITLIGVSFPYNLLFFYTLIALNLILTLFLYSLNELKEQLKIK